jgi:hypothetical protein
MKRYLEDQVIQNRINERLQNHLEELCAYFNIERLTIDPTLPKLAKKKRIKRK